jgi:hypothetical protein
MYRYVSVCLIHTYRYIIDTYVSILGESNTPMPKFELFKFTEVQRNTCVWLFTEEIIQNPQQLLLNE